MPTLGNGDQILFGEGNLQVKVPFTAGSWTSVGFISEDGVTFDHQISDMHEVRVPWLQFPVRRRSKGQTGIFRCLLLEETFDNLYMAMGVGHNDLTDKLYLDEQDLSLPSLLEIGARFVGKNDAGANRVYQVRKGNPFGLKSLKFQLRGVKVVPFEVHVLSQLNADAFLIDESAAVQ